MILVLAMAVTVAISQSLTDDGRIGKVNEAQGIVVLRTMLAKRWTPICRETLLRPGDWVRTELLGDDAAIIESSPNEAESHAAMAALRQNQNRWSEAIPHWNQVARLRKLEPTGLIKLAGAQLHEKQFAEAGETIQKLRNTPWPTRFGDTESQPYCTTRS